MPLRLRSVLYLLTAALAALTLAACGGGNAAGEEATADTDVNQLLKETFSGDKKVDSGRFDLALAVDAKGAKGVNGPVDVKLGGPFASQGKGKLPRFKLDAAVTGSGQDLKAGVTSTGDKGFVNFNSQDYAVSDQVFRQFVAGYEEAQKKAGQSGGNQQSLATLGIDPRRWLTSPKNAGEVKVGDADTIRITGGVDVPKLLDDANAALDKAGSLGLQGSGQVPQKLTDAQRRQVIEAVKNVSVEIFTGTKDKILRRMVVNLQADAPAGTSGAAAQSAVVKLDFSLTGLNQEQQIVAPAQTKPFEELLGSLGGLGGLGAGSSGSGSTGGANADGGASGASAADQARLKKYTDCVTAAGSDAKQAQECAKQLTP